MWTSTTNLICKQSHKESSRLECIENLADQFLVWALCKKTKTNNKCSMCQWPRSRFSHTDQPSIILMAHHFYLYQNNALFSYVQSFIKESNHVSLHVEFCRALSAYFLFSFLVIYIVHLVMISLFCFLYPLMNESNFHSEPPW